MVRSGNARGAWRPSARLVIGLATVVCVTLFGVALWRGNALYFGAGALAALAVLTPLWWSRPRVLLLALLFYLPLEDVLVGSFIHNQTAVRVLPDVLLMVAFVGLLMQGWRRRAPLRRTALDLPLAALLVVAVVSMVLNHIPLTQAVQGPYVLFRYATLFYLTAASRFTEREIRILVRGLVWVSVVESGLAILQFFNSGSYDLLPSGTMAGPNTLGIYVALTCTIAVAFYGDRRMQLPRHELGLVLGCAIAATLVALSRQSTLALVLGPVVICLFLVRLRALGTREGEPSGGPFRWHWGQLGALWREAASGVVGGVAGFLVVKLGGAGRMRPATLAMTRMLATLHLQGLSDWANGVIREPRGAGAYLRQIHYKTTQTGSSQLFSTNFYYNPRLYTIANATPAILRKSPLFGLGPGTFGARPTFHDHAFYNSLHVGLLLRDASFTFVADVEWMTILGQLGLLGVVGVLWLLFAIGRMGAHIWTRSHKPEAQALGSVCVALVPLFLVVCWFGPNLELRPIASLLWFLPGLALSFWRQENGQNPGAGEPGASAAAEAVPNAT